MSISQTQVIDHHPDFRIGSVADKRKSFDEIATGALGGKNLSEQLRTSGLSFEDARMAEAWRDTLGTFIMGVLNAPDNEAAKKFAVGRLQEEMLRHGLRSQPVD